MTRALCAFLLIWLAVAAPAAHAREVPMWAGIAKTDSQKAADRDFIETIRKSSNGNVEKGAVRAIQLGWQFIGKGDAENAIRRFNQAWLLAPKRGDIYWGFAIATGMRGDAPASVRGHFRKAHSIIGDDARLFSDWGRIELQLGDAIAARKHFERAIKLDPKYREPHVGMMDIGQRTGNAKLAMKHNEIVEKLDRDQGR